MTALAEGRWDQGLAPIHEVPLTVLAVISDEATRALLPRVLTADRLLVASDLAEGIAFAETGTPDVAFVDVGVGEGAGLAMVHHLKALTPDATVFALATKAQLESGAHAVALGGAGLFLLPLGGDEVLNAVGSVRVRLAERALRMQLEHEAARSARAAGWIGRVAELADARDRTAAAQQLAEVFVEATGAAGAAVYLSLGERSNELVRSAITPALEHAPAYGSEADILGFARRERLIVVPLALRKLNAGHVLLQKEPGRSSAFPSVRRPDVGNALAVRSAPLLDGLVKLLATQATTALALLSERERATGGAAMKDPTSSAYSFAYYVDVAGREIDKAKRYGRRFTIATVVVEHEGPSSKDLMGDFAWWTGEQAGSVTSISPAQVAEQLLHAVRDTDILARVDENELHLLMPETNGLEAHACYRRMLARLAGADKRSGFLPTGLLIGLATFPHDGQSLAQLLRVARRRADATKLSVVHRIAHDTWGIGELCDVIYREAPSGGSTSIAAVRPFELSLSDTLLLATSVVRSALRGGPVLIVVAQRDGLNLSAAIRAVLGPPREDVVMHSIDLRSVANAETVEALCVIAEHGAYVMIGRNDESFVRGIHAADPLLADFLAERLGRAVGLRVFG